MSEEIKFLYIWMLCRGTAKYLRAWCLECACYENDKIGIPNETKGYYYWCSANKMKEIIGV